MRCFSRTAPPTGASDLPEEAGSETGLSPNLGAPPNTTEPPWPTNIPERSWLPSVKEHIHLQENQPEKPVCQQTLTMFSQRRGKPGAVCLKQHQPWEQGIQSDFLSPVTRKACISLCGSPPHEATTGDRKEHAGSGEASAAGLRSLQGWGANSSRFSLVSLFEQEGRFTASLG